VRRHRQSRTYLIATIADVRRRAACHDCRVAVDTSYASASFHGQAPASVVTQALGLRPSSSHNLGERHGARNHLVREDSFWTFQSSLPTDGNDLEAHLRELVNLLSPKRPEIERLVTDGWTFVWACFISEDNGQGGLTLSPQILRDLAALQGELWLDIYAGGGEDEPAT
jgi:hypothetical protein